MNLLQIKQKMLEKAVSESYMADACGVSKLYLHQADGSVLSKNKNPDQMLAIMKAIQ